MKFSHLSDAEVFVAYAQAKALQRGTYNKGLAPTPIQASETADAAVVWDMVSEIGRELNRRVYCIKGKIMSRN